MAPKTAGFFFFRLFAIFVGFLVLLAVNIGFAVLSFDPKTGMFKISLGVFFLGIFLGLIVGRLLLNFFYWKYADISTDRVHKSVHDYG